MDVQVATLLYYVKYICVIIELLWQIMHELGTDSKSLALFVVCIQCNNTMIATPT